MHQFSGVAVAESILGMAEAASILGVVTDASIWIAAIAALIGTQQRDASTSRRGHRERQWLHQLDLLGESAAAEESAAAIWAAKQWLHLFRARLRDGR